MDKAKTHHLSGVSETLMIPLHHRAVESQRPDAILKDPKAVELVAAIDYDFAQVTTNPMDRLTTMMRARQFDRLARRFLEVHPNGAVVDLGCGLDTRFWRVDNGSLHWFELDLPEVMTLRRQLLGDTPRRTCLTGSVLDFSWMDAVAPVAGNGVLVLAEGLFVYLEMADVQRLLLELQRRFPGAEVVFDALSPLMIAAHRLDRSNRALLPLVRWGLKNGKELESWGGGTTVSGRPSGRGIRLLDEWFYFDQPEPRLGAAQLLRFVPVFRHGASVLHYRLG